MQPVNLSESIAYTLHDCHSAKGDHVLVDGQPVSTKYDRENKRLKEGKPVKLASLLSVRANSLWLLSRAEAEIPAQTTASEPASDYAPC